MSERAEKRFRRALASGEPRDLVDEILSRIQQRGWTGDLTGLNDRERTFVLVTGATSKLDNGGLANLFEAEAAIDPVEEAFRAIGAWTIAELVRLGANKLGAPEGLSEEATRRARSIELSRAALEQLDSRVIAALEAVDRHLAGFVRANESDFEHLASRTPYDPLTDSYSDS